MAELDPVCGQPVDDQRDDVLRAEFEGKYYYFCSSDCEEEFKDDPERYVGWGGASRFGSL